MKMAKLSLATLLALGAISSANAASLEEAIKGTTFSGYARGQLTSMFGEDASGTAFRTRLFASAETGAYHGFQIGTKILVSQGQGAPNGGRFLANSGNPNDLPTVGMYGLYGKQVFEEAKTTVKAGKITIAAPFADATWDYGYGASISNNSVEGITFNLQGYGAWGLDNANSAGLSLKLKDASGKPTATAQETASWDYSGINPNFNSDRPLFVFGVSGDSKAMQGVGFEIWAAHAIKTIDFLTYADINYSIAGAKIQAQIAVTQVDTSSDHFDLKGYDTKLFNNINGEDLEAKLRGLYNVQASYKHEETGIGVKAGFTGSFGDGYGALFNNYGSFNIGGNIWLSTLASGANGFGVGGVGGMKHLSYENGKFVVEKTDIMVGYFGLNYSGGGKVEEGSSMDRVQVGLDYAFIGGNNNYGVMAKTLQREWSRYSKDKTFKENVSGFANMDAQLHELAFTFKYNFTDKLAVSGIVGSTFGDLQIGKAQAILQYSF